MVNADFMPVNDHNQVMVDANEFNKLVHNSVKLEKIKQMFMHAQLDMIYGVTADDILMSLDFILKE